MISVKLKGEKVDQPIILWGVQWHDELEDLPWYKRLWYRITNKVIHRYSIQIGDKTIEQTVRYREWKAMKDNLELFDQPLSVRPGQSYSLSVKNMPGGQMNVLGTVVSQGDYEYRWAYIMTERIRMAKLKGDIDGRGK